MAVALSFNTIRVADEAGLITFWVNAVCSGTYPTGGDVVDFSTLAVPGLNVSAIPRHVIVLNQGGALGRYVPGTDMKTGKLKWMIASVAGVNQVLTEHTNVAYVAGITGDTIVLEVQTTQFVGL